MKKVLLFVSNSLWRKPHDLIGQPIITYYFNVMQLKITFKKLDIPLVCSLSLNPRLDSGDTFYRPKIIYLFAEDYLVRLWFVGYGLNLHKVCSRIFKISWRAVQRTLPRRLLVTSLSYCTSPTYLYSLRLLSVNQCCKITVKNTFVAVANACPVEVA